MASKQQPRLRGLGRIAKPDPRDQRYSMGSHLKATAPAITKDIVFNVGPILDQGSTPRCVGYSIAGVIAGGPIMQATPSQARALADRLYGRAQQIDEWPGEAYDGTSVRAGFKAATEAGYFGDPAEAEYVWGWDLFSTLQWMQQKHAPVVDGIDWYTGMFTPKKYGSDWYVEPTGSIEGGHAIRRTRYSVKRKATRWANSWNDGWGDKGLVWIHDDALSDLLRWGGESGSAIEKRLVPKTLGR